MNFQTVSIPTRSRFSILPLLLLCAVILPTAWNGVQAQSDAVAKQNSAVHAAHLQDGSETYARIKISLEAGQMNALTTLGISVDHGIRKPGHWFIGEFSESEIRRIRESGITCEVLIEDLEKHFLETAEREPFDKTNASAGQLKHSMPAEFMDPSDYAVPAGFDAGSMGGFYTLQEVYDRLDSMAIQYPGLITTRVPLGSDTTQNGRQVYYVRISDNAGFDEDEPAVLYTSLMHAREPAGMASVMFYMYYLLENYATNARIQYLVDNTEMYFVPVLNPDGYAYNESTSPGGGGFWRKNRRDNGGNFGVDLNRNFAYEWGYNDSGSSPTTFSDTYRGPSPASEPEVNMLQDFGVARSFVSALNFHSFGEYLIYPWGYVETVPTPDVDLFQKMGARMTLENGYFAGTAYETVNYAVNGVSDDWFYGEQTLKPKAFSLTPEVGYTFWPSPASITGICQDNMWTNLMNAYFATWYTSLVAKGGIFMDKTQGELELEVSNLGSQTADNIRIWVEGLDGAFVSTGNVQSLSGLSAFESRTLSVPYKLSNRLEQGDVINYVVHTDNGAAIFQDTITRYFAPSVRMMQNSGASDWEAITAYGKGLSVSDGFAEPYENNSTQIIQLKHAVDLTGVSAAQLRFNARWQIEKGFDYAQLQASLDEGHTWIPLNGRHTHLGRSIQTKSPLWDGYQNDWIEEEVDLTMFAGNILHLRFVLVSDAEVSLQGFEASDVQVLCLESTKLGQVQPNDETQLTIGTASPVPASDWVTIPVSGTLRHMASINVYDVYGRLKSSRRIDPGVHMNLQIKFDVSTWPVGMYYFTLQAEGTVQGTSKFQIGR